MDEVSKVIEQMLTEKHGVMFNISMREMEMIRHALKDAPYIYAPGPMQTAEIEFKQDLCKQLSEVLRVFQHAINERANSVIKEGD